MIWSSLRQQAGIEASGRHCSVRYLEIPLDFLLKVKIAMKTPDRDAAVKCTVPTTEPTANSTDLASADLTLKFLHES